MFTINADSGEPRVLFSADSRHLAVADGSAASDAEGVSIWDVARQEPVYRGGVDYFSYAEWHPREPELYVPLERSLFVLSPTGERLRELPKIGWFQGLAFSPDGARMITSAPFHIRCFKRTQGKWRKRWSEEINYKTKKTHDSIQSLEFFPDGERIMVHVIRWYGGKGYTDPGYFLIQRDLKTGAVLSERELSGRENPQGVRTRLVITPDGSGVIGFRGRSVYAWPIDSDAPGRKTTVAKKDVRDVALHPSGRWLLVACGSPEVSVWDTTTWKCARMHNWGVGAVEFVNFSPDGTLAAAASEQKAAVWDWDL